MKNSWRNIHGLFSIEWKPHPALPHTVLCHSSLHLFRRLDPNDENILLCQGFLTSPWTPGGTMKKADGFGGNFVSDFVDFFNSDFEKKSPLKKLFCFLK